jgi:uncharacterized repeat protein (TIGR03803 family)
VLRSRFHTSLITPLATLVFALLITLTVARGAEGASNYKILHSFTGQPDGGGVFAGVVMDGEGNLYGKTSGGGAYGYGTVFELTPGSDGRWTESILHSFCKDFPQCKDGTASLTGVVLDAAGNVYGSANYGPTFELTRGQKPTGDWVFNVIYNTGSDGLLLDREGDLYGEWGPGEYKAGEVFELMSDSAGWTEKVLYNFCPHRPSVATDCSRNMDWPGTQRVTSTA